MSNEGFFSANDPAPEWLRSVVFERPMAKDAMRSTVETAEEYDLSLKAPCMRDGCDGLVEFAGVVYGKPPHKIVDLPCSKCAAKYTFIHEESVP